MKNYSIGIILAAAAGLVILIAGAIRSLHVVAATHPARAAGGRVAPASAKSGDAATAPQGERVVRFASNAIPAPPFLLPDLSGNIVSTADWHGKVVLLNFWATWCGPCREEVPELIELQARYKDQLQIVAASMDETSPRQVKEFAQQFGINYSIVMASPEMLDEYGGVPALPTCFVISPEGRVVQKHVGLYPIDVYDAEVRALLGMPVDATISTFQDTGQIFLKNASLATELPGVDLKKLSASQKRAVLKQLNASGCNCGCKLTLAQCRINDTACPISRQLAEAIVSQALGQPKGGEPATR